MNPVEAQKLWTIILGEIETEVSRANFLTLFKKTALLSLEGETATIATSSPMTIDLLQKRFYSLIKKSLEKHTGETVEIVFTPKTFRSSKESAQDVGPLFSQEEQQQEYRAPTPMTRPLQRVRPDFTFETMAVSSSNQLAFVSARTVAKNLGASYNPLFIYGPVGVGKTHLMQAIANEVFVKNNEAKIVYITSEEFTNEVVEAIRTNDTAKMKKRFRSVSLLIIDDVQFIAGKDRVQEELFHTFNILIDKAAQVVLSSDRPPSEIKKLERRLSSRFASGLTVDVEEPDFELRTAILLIKAKKLQAELPIEAAKVIAQHQQDVRMLEGSLMRVVTLAKQRGEPITESLAVSVMGKGQEPKQRLHPDELIEMVCKFYDIKPTVIKGPKRDASIVKARQIAMYLLKKELDLTFVEIGNVLGGRDHTTVMHGVDKMEHLLINGESKTKISADIMGIKNYLNEERKAYK